MQLDVTSRMNFSKAQFFVDCGIAVHKEQHVP